jgi:glyoxylase-like metal-dependent hydrolase (beta-lactamase superfamily II)
MKIAIPFARAALVRTGLLICALTLPAASPAATQDRVKINSKWLGDRVLLTWACDYFQGTNMAVVVTDQGLVIIDTGLSPSTVRRQRELVERELGRSDFRYLINTHMHNDHAFANQVFPEPTVVGPANGRAALEREVAQIPELLERLRSSSASYGEWAAESSPDSAEGKQAREGVAAFTVGISDLEAGIEPRYPTVTFDRHHTLSLGDTRLELFELSGLHSDSDILILLPDQRMLFTGDVFWGGQLPMLREETVGDFPHLIAAWKTILEMTPDLTTIVPGHSDVPLTVADFRGMYQYLSRLWSDVQTAKEEGTSLERFLMRNVFEERYPEVAHYHHIRGDYNLHQHNIYLLWQLADC